MATYILSKKLSLANTFKETKVSSIVRKTMYPAVRALVLVLVFGAIYLDMEVIFRAILGRTHSVNGIESQYASLQGWTSVWMMLVGGVTGMLIGSLNEFKAAKTRHMFPFYQLRTMFGVLIIYTVEYFSGLLFNNVLKLGLWDYSDPLNIGHQITLMYLPLWIFMSVLCQWLDDLIRHLIFKEDWPGDFGQALTNLFRFTRP